MENPEICQKYSRIKSELVHDIQRAKDAYLDHLSTNLSNSRKSDKDWWLSCRKKTAEDEGRAVCEIQDERPRSDAVLPRHCV